MAKQYRKRISLSEAALKGALAATVGGAVMKLVWDVEQKALPPGERMGSPTRQAIDAIAEQRDLQLSETQKKAGALTLYSGNMALFGAVYGAVQSRLHPPDALHGLLLGGLVYAANFPSWGVLPKLGIYEPPTEQSALEAAVPIGAHVAFGLTTSAVFKALT